MRVENLLKKDSKFEQVLKLHRQGALNLILLGKFQRYDPKHKK